MLNLEGKKSREEIDSAIEDLEDELEWDLLVDMADIEEQLEKLKRERDELND